MWKKKEERLDGCKMVRSIPVQQYPRPCSWTGTVMSPDGSVGALYGGSHTVAVWLLCVVAMGVLGGNNKQGPNTLHPNNITGEGAAKQPGL